MRPERIWWWSTRLHRRGMTPLAKMLKLFNFLVFHAVLPYEVDLQPDIVLFHRGTGTVIHPNTTIGRRVFIGHAVTTSAGSQDVGSPHRVIVEDDVVLGAGSFVSARTGTSLTVGAGAQVGAHAVVTRDVRPGARMVGPKAVELTDRPPPPT